MKLIRQHLGRSWPLYVLLLGAVASLAAARILLPEAFNWPAWVQTVGSVAAVLIAVWVPYRQRLDAVQADKKKTEEESRRICLAISDELTMLQGIFSTGPNVKALLNLGPDEFFTILLPPVDPGERFAIYRAVIGRLTLIDDDQLRQDIITTYEWAIGLIHAGMQNNRMLLELDKLDADQNSDRYQQQIEQLRICASGMKLICQTTIDKVAALLPALARAAGRQ